MITYLFVGLGNYPEQYKKTRHNVGFMVIDGLCKKFNVDLTINKFNGLYQIIKIENGSQIIIAKPLTYMNLSGTFVQQIVNFYKIETTNIVIFCDDINLQLGDIRFRNKGSSGGQNGLKNIIQLLGTEEFKRFRIGISKPQNNMNLADYVLSEFKSNEKQLIAKAINAIVDKIYNFSLSKEIIEIKY